MFDITRITEIEEDPSRIRLLEQIQLSAGGRFPIKLR